ncbi:MAG: type II secretion system F family protein, partial [Proteobacteria bacterium]|nr:type II secretion system F family protein [Pseudomonadota bacterium]
YKARDEKGALTTGVMDGESRRAIYAQLDTMGLFPVSVTEEKKGASFSIKTNFGIFNKVKYDDMIFFTRQLQTVVRAGIPLISGLKALEEQTKNPSLKGAIKNIYQDIDKGQTFSDALAKHKNVFPEIYVSMIRAGEVSGSLEEVFERLSGVLEFQMKTQEMLKTAIRYPMFVISTLVGAFFVLIKFVVPKFAVTFKSAKIELPLPTKILLFISDIVHDYTLIVIVLLIAIVVAFIFYKRTKQGTLVIDRLLLKIPIIGPLILKICMNRFSFMLENLVRTGLPIVQTLEIVSKTVGNEFIAKKIKEISVKVEKGKGITGPMKEAQIFPPLVLHLVSTGEDTGALEEMMREISLHYTREVSYSVTRLTAWIEPIMTLGLAGMVLFMALAIFLPWWNLMSAMKGG